MPSGEYQSLVEERERSLSPLARRSFDPQSQQFLDGGEIFRHFEDRWGTEEGKASLSNRTPVQLERDRILYSPGLRKQTEKYHILYNGQRRIVRSFATHTMRSAQVSRAIARALHLNEDFAEAMALGSKVGATPFVHAAKVAVDSWLQATIGDIDSKCATGDNVLDKNALFDPALSYPIWIDQLRSVSTFESVKRHLAWGTGQDVDQAYSSGQASYWALACNPFTVQAIPRQFAPETMFGIWRHSLGLQDGGTNFTHTIEIEKATSGSLRIAGTEHASFEARVVQFADDITWAIENLADANSAAILNRNQFSKYDAFERELKEPGPTVFTRALHEHDAGGLYTYFISDFIQHSLPMLNTLSEDGGHGARSALGQADPSALIGLSETGTSLLEQLVAFLNAQVFSEARVKNRKEMLAEVSRQCVRLFYEGEGDELRSFITERAALERWSEGETTRAMELLGKDVHRAQASVMAFASMTDQEIYDFVGIQAL